MLLSNRPVFHLLRGAGGKEGEVQPLSFDAAVSSGSESRPWLEGEDRDGAQLLFSWRSRVPLTHLCFAA